VNGIIGVDVGTTGCRACIFNIEGVLISSASLEYPLYTPKPFLAEQNPEEIYSSVVAVIKSAVDQFSASGNNILAITLSTVFHSLILVDKDCNPLYPMLTWADLRSIKYSEYINSHYDASEIYNKTGCPIHPMYPLSKILWFRYEMPDIFFKTAKFISIKEYIIHKIFNKYIVDKSIASGTGFYNLKELKWDDKLLDLLRINNHQLSEVVSTTYIEYKINKIEANKMNISPEIPVVIGAGDGVLSAVGTGAVNAGQAVATIGTSGAVRVLVKSPQVDKKARTWCYNLTDEFWVLGGAINNGGIILRWLRDNFFPCEQFIAKKLHIDVYDMMTNYAANVSAGSDGLIMLPYFAGERSPYWNANARGVLFGLNLNHDKTHIARATIEGITYRMYSIFSALEDVTGDINDIRVSGSFIRSRLWLQIMSDVFGKTITVPDQTEGAAYGAVILGIYALGLTKDIKEYANKIKIKDRYFPLKENHQKYKQFYSIYEHIYWKLQKEFEEIAKIQRTSD
jgi:gluconokinase